MPLRALVLIAFFVGSLPVCFFRPFYGILLWIIVSFLNPQSYLWSSAEAFPWAAAVAIPTILGMALFDRQMSRLRSREAGLLLLLWFWVTVTTFVSINSATFVHHSAETWARWWFVSKILLMTFFMMPIVSSFERLRILTLTIAGCFGFYVAKSLPFVILTGGVFRLYGPDRSMIADNNDFGLALNMTLPIYFYLAQTEPRRSVRLLFAFLFVITIPAIFFTYSRGALVGLVAVAGVMFLQSRKRFMLVPVVAVGLAFAVFFAPDAWKERMDLTSPQALDRSAQSRLNAWAFARSLAADYPLTGGGFETFTPELYAQYWPTEIGNIYGPHSVYFQVLAEHGYTGLLIYLSVVISALMTTRRIRKIAFARNDTAEALYAQMYRLSLIGFLVSGLFLGRAYFDYYFTVVASIGILSSIVKEGRAERARDNPIAAAVA